MNTTSRHVHLRSIVDGNNDVYVVTI